MSQKNQQHFFFYNIAEYTFPYVKKRLRVCARRKIEQCPIQVAIDEMRQRVRELRHAVSAQPTDVKKLQLRLQVCIYFLLFTYGLFNKSIVFTPMSNAITL